MELDRHKHILTMSRLISFSKKLKLRGPSEQELKLASPTMSIIMQTQQWRGSLLLPTKFHRHIHTSVCLYM